MGRSRTAAVAALAVLALAAAGCGGGSSGSPEARAGARSAGEQVFRDAGCGDCHSLAAAGTDGSAGPDLDELRPSADRVARQVRSGGGGMPSFESSLEAAEIEAVADYVASAAQAAPKNGFTPDRVTVGDCTKRLDPTCYEQAFGNLAYERGPAVALQELERGMRENAAIEARCHPIAHTIGAGALLRFQGDVGRAFAGGSAACGSGYYHGLLEWKLAAAEPHEAAGVARSVCADERIRARPFLHYQCVHGLGHGLMLYARYDLPRALDLCHELPAAFDQVSCTGGVFMENQQTSYGITSKWLKDDDLLYPCTIVGEADKLYCYLLVTSHILPQVDSDWGETARWCRKSEREFVPFCFQSMGRDASGYARQEPVKIQRFCAAAGDMRHECLFGAVRDVINNDSDDLRARRLCETAPDSARSYCFYGLGSILGVVHPGESARRAACARFAAGRDGADCLRGARAAGGEG